jgi:squalene monooxygenase
MSLPIISPPPSGTHYDVIIVGGGVVGPALAYALSSASAIHGAPSPHRTLRTLLIDTRLREPDRIVGELLQPGGVLALKELGMTNTLDNMEAVRAYGYCIVRPKSTPDRTSKVPQFENVHIPYPKPHEGRSFHHGRFVQNLRLMAASAPGVELLEATVSSSLVSCKHTGSVVGVRATPTGNKEERAYLASMVVIANGSSNFRKSVYIPISPTPTPTYRPLETFIRGSFYGLVLCHPASDPKKPILPIPYHGTVILIPGCGPVLLYQISPTETRLLVDIPKDSPYAKSVEQYIREVVLPAFPTPELKESLRELIDDEEPSGNGKTGLRKWLRSMPNPFFPAPPQGRGHTREGVVLLGDSWNQRHPLTGGGMTVGLSDVVQFARGVSGTSDVQERVFGGKVGEGGDWGVVQDVLEDMWWERKGVAATVNILSVALYDLFKGDGEPALPSDRTTLF